MSDLRDRVAKARGREMRRVDLLRSELEHEGVASVVAARIALSLNDALSRAERDGRLPSLAVAVDAARGVAKRERWMVDYENEEGDPQHAVLSWLDDEATSLPEVGTYLVRESDARAVAVDAVAPPHFGVIDADDHAAGLRDPKVRETLDRVRAADVGGTDKPTVEELAEAVRSTPVPSVPAHRADASGSQTLLAAVAGDDVGGTHAGTRTDDASRIRPTDGPPRERWMVDYENEEGDPQHAVLSWLDHEATGLPEVGTYLIRDEDAAAVAGDENTQLRDEAINAAAQVIYTDRGDEGIPWEQTGGPRRRLPLETARRALTAALAASPVADEAKRNRLVVRRTADGLSVTFEDVPPVADDPKGD